jgi:hypothetical protein
MLNLIRVPLVFFFIASLFGLLLRWHLYQPIDGFVYPFWLHAHSHIMFLGWIFNAVSAGFVISFIPATNQSGYLRIWIMLNVLVVGMMVSFPLQGYGLYSIIISTLHTLLVAVFVVRFFKDTRLVRTEALAFTRMALLFFFISAAGPFALGVVMSKGLGHTPLYHLAVYYYLHFQYNGVFTFGIFGLLLSLLDKNGVSIDTRKVRSFRILLFVSCFPAFILSTLWTNPGISLNIAGFIAALLQIVAASFLFSAIIPLRHQIIGNLSRSSRVLLVVASFSFVLKLVLQVLSAFPYFARLAYEVRYYVIAYLHLVLVGMISFFLLMWYEANRYILIKRQNLGLLLLGFAGSEFAMIRVGLFGQEAIQLMTLISSFLMAVAIGAVASSSSRQAGH